MVPIWWLPSLLLIVITASIGMLTVRCCHVASGVSGRGGGREWGGVLFLPLLSALPFGQLCLPPSAWAYRGGTGAPSSDAGALSPAHSARFGKRCVLWDFPWCLLIWWLSGLTW